MLTPWDQGVLAQAYGLDRREIARDAALVANWNAPADDLLATLQQRRAWTAAAAYRYLRTLRRALRNEMPS